MRTLKSIFCLLLLAAVAYLGYRIVPAYIANYQFQDAMRTVATINSHQAMYRTSEVLGSMRSEDSIRRELYQQAQTLGVPVSQDQINVVRNGSEIDISADYTIHIDIPYHPIDLDFHPASKRM
jgi:hypothetical protein